MKRGEIYYITDRNTFGHEIRGARPGVIVSNDTLNHNSEVVEVVYLTTQPKKELPTHARINATGRESTVLCEQVDTVAALLVGDYCGTCTPDEMAAIERGLLASLDLAKTRYSKDEDTNAPMKPSSSEERLLNRLAEVQEERDRYMRMVDVLLAEREA